MSTSSSSSLRFDAGPSPVRAALEERLERGELDLPMLPRTAHRVLEVAEDEGADAKALAALVEQDPTMAARLLRTANSAAYAPEEPIVSLQQAVARLGLQTVRAIAFASAAQGSVFRSSDGARRVERLWRHSAAAACLGTCDRPHAPPQRRGRVPLHAAARRRQAGRVHGRELARA